MNSRRKIIYELILFCIIIRNFYKSNENILFTNKMKINKNMQISVKGSAVGSLILYQNEKKLLRFVKISGDDGE